MKLKGIQEIKDSLTKKNCIQISEEMYDKDWKISKYIKKCTYWNSCLQVLPTPLQARKQ